MLQRINGFGPKVHPMGKGKQSVKSGEKKDIFAWEVMQGETTSTQIKDNQCGSRMEKDSQKELQVPKKEVLHRERQPERRE